jgi:hypothetical protein
MLLNSRAASRVATSNTSSPSIKVIDKSNQEAFLSEKDSLSLKIEFRDSHTLTPIKLLQSLRESIQAEYVMLSFNYTNLNNTCALIMEGTRQYFIDIPEYEKMFMGPKISADHASLMTSIFHKSHHDNHNYPLEVATCILRMAIEKGSTAHKIVDQINAARESSLSKENLPSASDVTALPLPLANAVTKKREAGNKEKKKRKAKKKDLTDQEKVKIESTDDAPQL